MIQPQKGKQKIIRDQLEEVKLRFLNYLEDIPDHFWEWKSTGKGWTVKQEMVHILQVIQVIPHGIKRAITGKKHSLLSFIPANFRSWINGNILIPIKAKKETRATIAEQYKVAHKELIELISLLSDADFEQGLPYPRKYRSVEQMALRPVEHFTEHEEHLVGMLNIEKFARKKHDHKLIK